MEATLVTLVKQTKAHSLPAHLRIILAVTLIVAIVLSGHIYSLIGYFLIALILWIKSPMSLLFGLKRLMLVDSMVVLTIIPLPFSFIDDRVVHLGGLVLSEVGILKAQEVFIKVTISAIVMMSQNCGTSGVELSRALSLLRVPIKLILLLQFCIRYISVIQQEVSSLRIAMRARGFGNGSTLHNWRSYGYLFGMLLVRALERADRIWFAMKCRGYQGIFPVIAHPEPVRYLNFRFLFWVFISIFLLVLDLMGIWPKPVYF